MFTSSPFLIAVRGAAIAGLLFLNAQAGVQHCGTANVTVQAPNEKDAIDSCRGADAAVRFLVAHGMALPPAISITIVGKMPEGIPESALGAYSREDRRVTMLTYSAFRAREKKVRKFGIPIHRAHYRAATAHEVAHAVTHYNFRTEPSLLVSEYISYVTLFHTLPSAERKRVLQNYVYDDDWEKRAAFLYVEDPVSFGAHAYRDFVRQKNGAAYLRKLLSGESPMALPGE